MVRTQAHCPGHRQRQSTRGQAGCSCSQTEHAWNRFGRPGRQGHRGTVGRHQQSRVPGASAHSARDGGPPTPPPPLPPAPAPVASQPVLSPSPALSRTLCGAVEVSCNVGKDLGTYNVPVLLAVRAGGQGELAEHLAGQPLLHGTEASPGAWSRLEGLCRPSRRAWLCHGFRHGLKCPARSAGSSPGMLAGFAPDTRTHAPECRRSGGPRHRWLLPLLRHPAEMQCDTTT